MKIPPLVLAGIVLVCGALAAVVAIVARAERGRNEDLRPRITALEDEVAALKARPAAAAERVPDSRPPEVVAPGLEAPRKGGPDRIAELERQVARLNERVKELDREAGEDIGREIAGATAEQLWEKVEFARQDGRSERAHKLLKEFRERFPNDPHVPEALVALAMDEVRGDDWGQAMPILEEVLRDHPKSPHAAYAAFYLGMGRIASKDLPGGVKYYEESMTLLEGQPYWQAAANYNIAEAYENAGDPTTAREYWKKVTQFKEAQGTKEMVEEAEAKLK